MFYSKRARSTILIEALVVSAGIWVKFRHPRFTKESTIWSPTNLMRVIKQMYYILSRHFSERRRSDDFFWTLCGSDIIIGLLFAPNSPPTLTELFRRTGCWSGAMKRSLIHSWYDAMETFKGCQITQSYNAQSGNQSCSSSSFICEWKYQKIRK